MIGEKDVSGCYYHFSHDIIFGTCVISFAEAQMEVAFPMPTPAMHAVEKGARVRPPEALRPSGVVLFDGRLWRWDAPHWDGTQKPL